eukprot:Phypoly_transcript_09870.p1 GENE.Phypoly_transcript_09870~~Phypoly_transcript_09870.p1  ORF type:complete len:411 (+),score=55.18 Phypoly_transcript_09870:129-1361(+)
MGFLKQEPLDVANALGSLSSALDAVSSIGKQVEQRYKELEKWEEHLRAMEKEIAKREEELKAKESELQHKYESDKGSEEVEDQKIRAERNARGTLRDCKFSTKIVLNVGGKLFATTKSTLLQYRGSFLESLVTNQKSKQENGEFFIDRDPTYFEIVLNFMREGRLRNTGLHNTDLEDLRHEFQFYKVDMPSCIQPAPVTPFLQRCETGPTFPIPTSLSRLPLPRFSAPPNLGSPSSFERGGLLPPSLQDVVRKWLPNQSFFLLHKSSIHGFKCPDFHTRCDNKGPTLTIIQSKEGFLFGGYSPESWENPTKNHYKTNPFAFIFTLTNPHNIPPTKYLLQPADQHAIFCSTQTCSAFGGGHDIVLHANSHQNKHSYTHFPSSYIDTTGKGKETFTGSLCFSSKDVEIYSVS